MSNPIIWSYWNHEPIYHLKRMGNDGGTVFSLGEWVDEWYDRIHGEELIKKGAGLGINTVYTHYYKGSGILFEKEEMQRTKEFAEIAHKYGIKVLGYMSMGSIYTENITREIPDVSDMLVIDRFGNNHPTLTDQYYRPRPCYNNDKYLKHLKSIIRYGIEEIGLDGFHFDNSSFCYCYCENCQRKFREYLNENFKNPYEVMGIKYFDHVRIPFPDYPGVGDTHEIAPKGNIHDVLVMWYLRFLRKTVADFHKACFDYVKEVSHGNAKVLHNPGFPRSGRDARVKGYDPTITPESCDYVFVENSGGYFGKHTGRITGQSMAFKYGERFGYKVFDTSWAKDENKVNIFPRNKEDISGFVLHAAVFGGITGVPWTVRSMKNRDEVAIDTEYLYEGLKEAFSYFKDNYEIFDTVSYNKVKLLHHVENIHCCKDGRDELYNTAHALTKNCIPYSIITEEEISTLGNGDTVILPGIFYCSEKLYDDLKNAYTRGVDIIALSGFGHYNENTKGRSLSSEVIDLKGIADDLVVTSDRLIDRITKTVSTDTDDVLIEIRLAKNGSLILHVLNADSERDLPETTVIYEDEKLLSCRKFRVFTPDDSAAVIEITGNKAVVKIKNLKTLVSIMFEEDTE